MQQSILSKLQRYCAYQDRCEKEVRNKLFELKVYGEEQEEIINQLKQERFLDEIRYAESFVRGKFRMKKWGRVRIVNELKFKNIKDSFIKNGLKEIDEKDYLATLTELLNKKLKSLKGANAYIAKNKTATYLINKGYERDLVWSQLGRN